LTIAKETWRALDARLREAGVDAAYLGPIARACAALLEPMRVPMRAWHARQRREPAAYLVRLLMLGDPVTSDEARAGLGAFPLDALLSAGIVERTGDGSLSSPYRMHLVDGIFILCDDLSRGGEAVMGAGETTAALGFASRAHGVATARVVADIGCGAGTLALLASRTAERVIATDVSERALVLTRVNAMLAGVTNIEVRQGDLLAPLAGERVDLVVSQPPFVARPPGHGDVPFLYGGARGDEVALRLIEQLAQSLTPGGRAVIMADWPTIEADDAPIETRVRRALGKGDFKLLVVETPNADIDEQCAYDALTTHPHLDDAYARAAMARRDHLAKMRVSAIVQSIVVIVRGSPSWTATVHARPLGASRPSKERIDKVFAARDLLQEPPTSLLRAKLRLVKGTLFVPDGKGGVDAHAPDHALAPRLGMSVASHRFLVLLDVSESARTAIEQLASATGEDLASATSRGLEAVRIALARGVIEIA
jgi:precorrin-6B methylase 2